MSVQLNVCGQQAFIYCAVLMFPSQKLQNMITSVDFLYIVLCVHQWMCLAVVPVFYDND